MRTTTTKGGAGRQRARGPKRPYLLSVRVDDLTKAALERAATRKKLTLSAEAAWRLDRSVADEVTLDTAFGSQENRGIAALVVKLADGLQIDTGRSWRTDPYTYREFAAGVTVLMQGLPRLLGLLNEPAIPERLRQRYPKPPSTARAARDYDPYALPGPGQLGQQIALGLLTALPLYPAPPETDRPMEYAREYFEFPRIYRDLQLDQVVEQDDAKKGA